MPPKKPSEEERCDCGKLLFKWTSRGLEFKCNRCKRIHLVPFEFKGKDYRNLCPIVDKADEDVRGG